MLKFIKSILLLTLGLSLISCSTINSKIAKYTGLEAQKDKEIATLRADFETKLEANTVSLNKLKEQAITNRDNQIKAAANGMYGADFVYDTILEPTRTDLIVHNFVLESWTALGHMMPDYPTLLEINKRVKKDLDATQTSLATLKKEHGEVVAANQQLVDRTKLDDKELSRLKDEKTDLINNYGKQLDKKQTAALVYQKYISQLQSQRADAREAIVQAKTKASSVLGIIALACLAGVIWSPIGKKGLAIFGGLASFGAIAIWYIEGWMVLAAVGLGAAGLIVWGLRSHFISDKANIGFVHALHAVEEKSKEVYDSTVKPEIDEYTKKYAKDKEGNVVTVPDPTISTLIDQKLMDSDRK